MATIAVAAAASSWVASDAAGDATDVCRPPACVDAAVPLPAHVRVHDNRVRVLLPDGYAADPCARWPVLHLLHGAGDTWKTWSERSDVVAATRGLPLIVVMADGGNTPDAGWYSDWANGSRQYESFVVDAVVPWLDATYRTAGAAHRTVAGLSMGGFGAMSLSARNPGVFRAAASISGFLDTMLGFPASGPAMGLANPYAGTPDERVWGDQIEDEETWRAHNPTDLAALLGGVALFLYAGTGTPAGGEGDDPSKAGNYAVEHYIFQMNLSFTRALDAAGLPYESDFHPGYHDWPYHEAGLHWALPKLVAAVGGPVAEPTCVAARTGGTDPSGAPAATLPATGGGQPGGLVAAIAIAAAVAALAARAARRA